MLVTTWPWTIAFHFSATNWAVNFGCYPFTVIQDIVSKLLRAAIWSLRTVWLESEQSPFPRTGCGLRSAALLANLHRIQLGTRCFVPMSDLLRVSETNEWLQDWAKRWVQLWFAITSLQFHQNFHFTWKKMWLVAALYLQCSKTFLTVELSQ